MPSYDDRNTVDIQYVIRSMSVQALTIRFFVYTVVGVVLLCGMRVKSDMAAKKLYSLRIDIELLEALRTKADREEITVSELIHNLLSEALGIGHNEADKKAVNNQNLATLIEELKSEIKSELRAEMRTLSSAGSPDQS